MNPQPCKKRKGGPKTGTIIGEKKKKKTLFGEAIKSSIVVPTK
jgi:hypothetical protein